jgi:hypothetical protein
MRRMSTYRIIRSITPLVPEGFACTVMGVREDTAGRNEYGVRVCATALEANIAADALEREIRERIAARGEAVSTPPKAARALAG